MEKNSKNKVKRGTKSGKKKERTKYSSDALHLAVQAVAKGMLSVRKAADTYGIPQTTLFRKFKNPDKLNCRSGPPTVLSEKEEAEIVNWIRYRSERGFPITKTDLLNSVQTYITCLKKNTPFIDNKPGRHWYEGFQKRHPDLSTRTAQHLTFVRASVTEENLRGWFQEIGTYLTSKDLLNIHPSRVFNCDKTNIQLCPKPEKVLAKKGAHSVYKVVDANEKESVTSLFMYNAEGTRAPPLIIYPYKKSVPKKVLENVPSGWGIGISESGRMTTETFYEYIANVFYPWLLKENIHFPIVLYLDGHSLHVTIPLVSFCREKKIELISLYPNATHIIQPLDVALFHPFKDLWKKTVPKWKLENNILRLKKEQFPAVLKIALDSFTEERKIIQSGFKTCGLMPFNPDAVEYYVLHKKKKTTSSEENNQPQEKENLTANQQFVSNTVYEDRDHYLQMFERTLRPELLQEFKNDESTEIWTGSIEKKGLFEYWLEIKKRGHSTGIEKLENHKVTIIPKLVEDVPFEENMPSCNQQGIDSIVTVVKVENCLEQNYLENEHIVPLQISHGTSNIHFNDIQNSTLKLDPNSLEFTDITHSSSESNIEVLNSTQTESIFDANVNVPDSILQDNLQQKEININNVVSTVNNEGTDVVEENKENETFFNKDNNNDNQSKIFANAFTLPHKYLPKKNKVKLEATGKAKLPSAGISDDWWKAQLEKEQQQNIKEEKAAKRKCCKKRKKISRRKEVTGENKRNFKKN